MSHSKLAASRLRIREFKLFNSTPFKRIKDRKVLPGKSKGLKSRVVGEKKGARSDMKPRPPEFGLTKRSLYHYATTVVQKK